MLKVFLELNIRLLLVLLLFGMITGFLRRYTYSNLSTKKHGTFIIDFFNLIGIPVHEIGHLLFALFFGYQIKGVCFFRTIKKSRKFQGTLGYVKMSHKTDSVFAALQVNIGQFFVGIGPLISGPAVIITYYYFLPQHIKHLLASFSEGSRYVIKSLYMLNGMDILILLLFLYILIGISMNMELSMYDLEMAWKGLFFLEIIFLLIAFCCTIIGIDITPAILSISKYIIMISIVGIVCSLLTNLFSMIGLQ